MRLTVLAAGNLTGQALAAGLVVELSVNLVSAVFGSAIRFFGDYTGTPVLLTTPQVVPGE